MLSQIGPLTNPEKKKKDETVRNWIERIRRVELLSVLRADVIVVKTEKLEMHEICIFKYIKGLVGCCHRHARDHYDCVCVCVCARACVCVFFPFRQGAQGPKVGFRSEKKT